MMIILLCISLCTCIIQAGIQRLWPTQVVRVIDDMPEVMKLQVGHGEWRDEMENVRAKDDELSLHYTCR